MRSPTWCWRRRFQSTNSANRCRHSGVFVRSLAAVGLTSRIPHFASCDWNHVALSALKTLSDGCHVSLIRGTFFEFRAFSRVQSEPMMIRLTDGFLIDRGFMER
jgi:hypothetical protein